MSFELFFFLFHRILSHQLRPLLAIQINRLAHGDWSLRDEPQSEVVLPLSVAGDLATLTPIVTAFPLKAMTFCFAPGLKLPGDETGKFFLPQQCFAFVCGPCRLSIIKAKSTGGANWLNFFRELRLVVIVYFDGTKMSWAENQLAARITDHCQKWNVFFFAGHNLPRYSRFEVSPPRRMQL